MLTSNAGNARQRPKWMPDQKKKFRMNLFLASPFSHRKLSGLILLLCKSFYRVSCEHSSMATTPVRPFHCVENSFARTEKWQDTAIGLDYPGRESLDGPSHCQVVDCTHNYPLLFPAIPSTTNDNHHWQWQDNGNIYELYPPIATERTSRQRSRSCLELGQSVAPAKTTQKGNKEWQQIKYW